MLRERNSTMREESFLNAIDNATRILVVDSSRTYGMMVKEALIKHVRNVEVEVATNVWELKRRLEKKDRFHLIIADLSAAFDGDEMSCFLYDTGALVILWSAFKGPSEKSHFREMKKPVNMDEMRDIAPVLVGYGANSSGTIPAVKMELQP